MTSFMNRIFGGDPKDVLHQAENYFQKQNLDLPYLTEGEKGKLKKPRDELFSSKKKTENPYDVEKHIEEALTKKVEDYVLFGAAGHGVNSRFMHYYAVDDHIAVFFQLRYGNVDDDPEETRDRINEIFEYAHQLREKMDKAVREKKVEDGKRLLVTLSDYRGSGWCWIENGSDEIDEDEWNPGDVKEAIDEIP